MKEITYFVILQHPRNVSKQFALGWTKSRGSAPRITCEYVPPFPVQ